MIYQIKDILIYKEYIHDLTVVVNFAIDGVCINVLENYEEKMSVNYYDKQETFV